MFKTINWNTGSAAARYRLKKNKKIKKKERAQARKRQGGWALKPASVQA